MGIRLNIQIGVCLTFDSKAFFFTTRINTDSNLLLICGCFVVESNTENPIIPEWGCLPSFDKVSGNWRGSRHQLLTFF